MLGFAVDGILFGHSFYISTVLALLLLVCIVYNLLHWGSRRVTYRTMYKDTKDMSVQIWQNLKTSINEVSSAIKKKTTIPRTYMLATGILRPLAKTRLCIPSAGV